MCSGVDVKTSCNISDYSYNHHQEINNWRGNEKNSSRQLLCCNPCPLIESVHAMMVVQIRGQQTVLNLAEQILGKMNCCPDSVERCVKYISIPMILSHYGTSLAALLPSLSQQSLDVIALSRSTNYESYGLSSGAPSSFPQRQPLIREFHLAIESMSSCI